MVQQVIGFNYLYSPTQTGYSSQTGGTDASSGTNTFGDAVSAEGASSSSSTAQASTAGSDVANPFQQLSSSLQSFLVQLQSVFDDNAANGQAASAANGFANEAGIEADAGKDATGQANSAPVAGHHHHHHHEDTQQTDGTTGSADGSSATGSASMQATAQSFANQLMQAMQTYSPGSSSLAGAMASQAAAVTV